MATPRSGRGRERKRRPHIDPGAAHRLLMAADSGGDAENVGRGRSRFEAALTEGPAGGGRQADASVNSIYIASMVCKRQVPVRACSSNSSRNRRSALMIGGPGMFTRAQYPLPRLKSMIF